MLKRQKKEQILGKNFNRLPLSLFCFLMRALFHWYSFYWSEVFCYALSSLYQIQHCKVLWNMSFHTMCSESEQRIALFINMLGNRRKKKHENIIYPLLVTLVVVVVIWWTSAFSISALLLFFCCFCFICHVKCAKN